MGETMTSEQTKSVTGNILLFYAYDIGDDVDLEVVKKKTTRQCF